MSKHKLAQVMLERDAAKQLTGRVQIDDAYVGGERTAGDRVLGGTRSTAISRMASSVR